MANKLPGMFFREARQCWFLTMDGRQVKLARDKTESEAMYHRIMADRAQASMDTKGAPGDSSPEPPVPERRADGLAMRFEDLADRYLTWAKQNQAKATYDLHRGFIQKLVDTYPKGIRVGDLRPAHVNAAMHANPKLSASTKNSIGRTAMRVLNWAVDELLIDRSPIRKVRKPRPEFRQVIITPDEYAAILAYYKDGPFRDLVRAAWHTGARASEIMRVEARHYDPVGKFWRFASHESKGGQHARTVFLDDVADEITARLAAKNPTGRLFRNRRGVAWTKGSIFARFARFGKLKSKHYMLTHIRHSFAHRLLVARVDSMRVATLMGHQDTNMLMRVYGHLIKDPTGLRAELDRANASQPGVESAVSLAAECESTVSTG